MRTRDIVIMTVWRRAEFAAAALRRLTIADDGCTEYWIYADRGHTSDVVEVACRFAQNIGGGRVRVERRLPHPYRGNSFNTLHALREAHATGPALIHLIEEDVFVAADYLRYARAAHALADKAFAVSACRNQNLTADPAPDPSAVYPHRSYQSLAVSFRPQTLDLVLPHITPAYFASPIGYCADRWPWSAVPAGAAEQDGLLNRIAEHANLPTIYPAVPRAYHAGFCGYNRRGLRLGGPVEVAATRLLAMSAEELNARARSYPDHVTAELDPAERPAPARLLRWPVP